MRYCRDCNRPKNKGHICDFVELSDGRYVHASRVELGGDLREKLGDDLKVVFRFIDKNEITPKEKIKRREAL